jgi:signal transduction histidine kinase
VHDVRRHRLAESSGQVVTLVEYDTSGSSGLRDRVEAPDGTLRAESPRGSGTLLRASFPAAPEVRE